MPFPEGLVTCVQEGQRRRRCVRRPGQPRASDVFPPHGYGWRCGFLWMHLVVYTVFCGSFKEGSLRSPEQDSRLWQAACVLGDGNELMSYGGCSVM